MYLQILPVVGDDVYKKVYSVKLHKNLSMDLIATTNHAIPRGFALIVGQGVSS